MSTREHEKRHKSRRSRSPRPSPSVFSRIRRERSRSSKQKIVTTSAPTRDIRKRTQKVRTEEAVIENQNQRKIDQVGRKTTYPSRGHIKTYNGSEDPDDHLKIFQAAAKIERGKWQPQIMSGRSRFHHRSKKKDEGEGTEGQMIIEAEIGGHCIYRMYVDGGSASEILYEHCFNRLCPEIKNQLVPAITPLIGFSGEIIWPIGQIQLLVRIGDEEHFASARMNFVVVRSPSSYNEIIGKPGVRKLQAVLSMAQGMLKLPVEGGASKPIVEERVKVAINPEYPEQTIMIGSTLTEEGRNKLYNLLQRNLDIFAWKPTDMTSVPIHIAEHRLNVREGCSLVRQKKKGQVADRNQAIQEEVGKLVEAGIMKEIHYHDWLSNLTAEAKEAFKQMKQLIAELPMLTAPMEKEELIVYLEAAKETVSAVLMTEREAKQMPIYFVSRALRGPELNYMSMKKLGLALVHAIKGQILADFIVERPEEGSSDILMEVEEELPEPWILFTDGSSCTDGSGVGLILTNPKGVEFTYALKFRFDTTNNEAEYEALIARLRIAKQMGVKNLQVNVDSRLVANQVNQTYVAKEVDMIRYLEKVRTLTNSFKAFSIKQDPRSENKKADALSKIASTSFAHLSKQVLVEELKEKSIREVEILKIVEEEGDT
uniref:Reverse transcriptase domain-containing protein n=1 Tax=Tanacetum cinerariifolium TaxID=118510 RepID=A0A699H8X5_TANCI|nr:reverse transcriptase domain-containing protein [Tanacetum cinerariifolium]